MNKFIGKLFLLISGFCMFFCFSGCDGVSGLTSHEHTFSMEYSSDETDHWFAATCEHKMVVSGKEHHSFGEYSSDNNATTSADGTKSRTCSVCKYVDTVTDSGTKVILTVAAPVFSVETGAVNSGQQVTIDCSTEGAKIYYTTDGSVPTNLSSEYKTPFEITEEVIIKAIAIKEGMNNSVVITGEYWIKGVVKSPDFSVISSPVNSGTELTLSCLTEGADIYYTTDGSTPSKTSDKYTDKIIINPPVTIKAIAVKENMNDSGVSVGEYSVRQTLNAPEFSIASGFVNSGTELTLTCTTEGADIYYTTDESTPDQTSTKYTDKIIVNPPVTIKAVAIKEFYNDSSVVSEKYQVKQTVATPSADVTGPINSNTDIKLSCATEGAVIHYTTDGSTPTASSDVFSESITVSPPVTIKAIAVKENMNDSAVFSSEYSVKQTVKAPEFSIGSGFYGTGEKLTLSCETEGAEIYYTTNGSVPTESGKKYSGEISITPPMTVKAIAVKEGLNNSSVSSAEYKVKQTAAAPSFSEESGELPSGTEVTITSETADASIYYTTDSSVPGSYSTKYTGPIKITNKVTIKAVAIHPDMYKSSVTTIDYLIKAPSGISTVISDDYVKVTGVEILGTENWVPSSIVFYAGRNITIGDLIVGRHEVTRKEYKAVTGNDPSPEGGYDLLGKSVTGDEALLNPVSNVSWRDAIIYCNKLSEIENLVPCYASNGNTDVSSWNLEDESTWRYLICNTFSSGYRLPFEEEWEYLARAGDDYNVAGFGYGDPLRSAWCRENSLAGTHEVMSKRSNSYSLYDMSGNVAEWCWDKTGVNRILRGGHYFNDLEEIYLNVRASDYETTVNEKYGFRVVRKAN